MSAIAKCHRCAHASIVGGDLTCDAANRVCRDLARENRCPNGFFDGDTLPPARKIPAATAAKAVNLAIAATFGAYVSDEIRAEREAICRECEMMAVDKAGEPRCTLCGCGVSGRRIINLAAYEERLPRWGCKHPARGHGIGWVR